jgi:hypothetical protein
MPHARHQGKFETVAKLRSFEIAFTPSLGREGASHSLHAALLQAEY